MSIDRRTLLKVTSGLTIVCWPISGIQYSLAQPAPPLGSIIARFPRVKFLEGVSFSPLPPELVTGSDNMVIWADEIVLAGQYATDGASLALIARKIRIEPNTTISTAGNVGRAAATPKANDGTNTGDDGAPGTQVENGHNGGACVLIAEGIDGMIVVDSHGGIGAPGQNGGNGAPGRSYGKAANCTAGTQGGTGGRGGLGSKGGDGGQGGDIQIQTLDAIPVGSLNFSLNGGQQGPPGQHGGPGGPGTGGIGGDVSYHFEGGPGPRN